jgi:hypothetical protein
MMLMMRTMPEPIRSTPESPSHRLRFSLRRMMLAVALIAVLLSLWIPTFQIVTDWKSPQIGELWIVGFLMLVETILVYYITLAVIIARGVIKQVGSGTWLSRVLVFAPVSVIVLVIYVSVLLAILAQLPWF